MAYTKVHDPWHNAASATGGGDTSTPLTAAALDTMETGIANAHVAIDNHIADTTDAHAVSAITNAASLAIVIALG